MSKDNNIQYLLTIYNQNYNTDILRQLYHSSDAPHYIKGHTLAAFMMATVAVLAIIFKHLLNRENKRRENLSEEEKKREEEMLSEPSDKHPDFRYIT